MKRYADQFRRLDTLLKTVGIKRWMQNGHQPHYNPASWMHDTDTYSKGVKADCLYVYQPTSRRKRYGEYESSAVSIGFSFYYQNAEQAPVILYSCKIGKKLHYSLPILVSEFSPVLKSIIGFVQSMNLKGSTPVEQEGHLTEIAEHLLKMMGAPGDIRIQRKNADQRVLAELKALSARLELAELQDHQAADQLGDAQQRVRNRISRTKVYKEVLDLKRQLEIKMAELNAREAVIMQEEGVSCAESRFKQTTQAEVDAIKSVHASLVGLMKSQDALMASADTRGRIEDQLKSIEKQAPFLRDRRQGGYMY
jgi:hypothetical protein